MLPPLELHRIGHKPGVDVEHALNLLFCEALCVVVDCHEIDELLKVQLAISIHIHHIEGLFDHLPDHHDAKTQKQPPELRHLDLPTAIRIEGVEQRLQPLELPGAILFHELQELIEVHLLEGRNLPRHCHELLLGGDDIAQEFHRASQVILHDLVARCVAEAVEDHAHALHCCLIHKVCLAKVSVLNLVQAILQLREPVLLIFAASGSCVGPHGAGPRQPLFAACSLWRVLAVARTWVLFPARSRSSSWGELRRLRLNVVGLLHLLLHLLSAQLGCLLGLRICLWYS
mmetsp:Transcript_71773/g.171502  ORF Transcript_71773/g.171502 Transcript_71773/m.171502 type:complete len:287 (-) Transcript_71773:726-1586(-)